MNVGFRNKKQKKMGNSANKAPKLEYAPLIWPKKKCKWDNLIIHIDQFLMTFVHNESPQETLKQLNVGVYQICTQFLSKKKKMLQKKPNRFQKREEIIAKIYTKNTFPTSMLQQKSG